MSSTATEHSFARCRRVGGRIKETAVNSAAPVNGVAQTPRDRLDGMDAPNVADMAGTPSIPSQERTGSDGSERRQKAENNPSQKRAFHIHPAQLSHRASNKRKGIGAHFVMIGGDHVFQLITALETTLQIAPEQLRITESSVPAP
jgi:hypothetical protein